MRWLRTLSRSLWITHNWNWWRRIRSEASKRLLILGDIPAFCIGKKVQYMFSKARLVLLGNLSRATCNLKLAFTDNGCTSLFESRIDIEFAHPFALRQL